MLKILLLFFGPYEVYFQMALGVWQILKCTLAAAVIQALLGRLLSLALPRFFPAYGQLRYCPGRLFKRVNCVAPTKGRPESKTKLLTEPENQVTTTDHSSADMSETSMSTATNLNSTVASEGQAELTVFYLGKTFKVKREGRKVFVDGEMSYHISNREWEKICRMEERCFKKKALENEVVFVKGCRFIMQTVATGEVMEFREVLDDVILENNMTLLISNGVWFLPIDLSEKSEGKLPKFLNLVGLLLSTTPSTQGTSAYFTIASAILEIKPVRSCFYWIINKMFCRSVQYICNKLPYSVRRCVYLLLIWVENLNPWNDIRLNVPSRDYAHIVIGGSAKINNVPSRDYAHIVTHMDWLCEQGEYDVHCGMKATYNDVRRECTVTVQHNNAFFDRAQRYYVKCRSREEFMKIGTFLQHLANSGAGSLFQYDRNDDIVYVRSWRGSLRDYVDAEFPAIYKLTLHDVIV